MRLSLLKVLASSFVIGMWSAQAAAAEEIVIQIKNHQFEPAQIVVPANKKIKLKVQNLDSTAEEFESYELDREKVVAGNATVSIFVGPLAPGAYPFFGEFNPTTAKGQITAK